MWPFVGVLWKGLLFAGGLILIIAIITSFSHELSSITSNSFAFLSILSTFLFFFGHFPKPKQCWHVVLSQNLNNNPAFSKNGHFLHDYASGLLPSHYWENNTLPTLFVLEVKGMVFYHLLPLWSLCVTLQGGCLGVLTVFPSVGNQESDKHLPFPVRKNVSDSHKGNVKKIIALENATYTVVKSCEKR